MLNLVKMNVYRMVRTKMAWVILAVIMLLAAFTSYMNQVNTQAAGSDTQSSESIEQTVPESRVTIDDDGFEMNFGIESYAPVSSDGTQPDLIQYLMSDLQSGLLLILVAIFAALFVNEEESTGFIKNIARLKKRKSMLVIARTLSVIGYIMIMVVVYAIAELIFTKIVYPDASLGVHCVQLGYVAVQSILLIAFGTFIIFITTLVKNSSAGVVVGIILASGLGYLFTELINYKVNAEGFNLNKYVIVGTINSLSATSSQETLLQALLVGVVWFVIFLGLSVFVTEKRDVI